MSTVIKSEEIQYTFIFRSKEFGTQLKLHSDKKITEKDIFEMMNGSYEVEKIEIMNQTS